MKQHMLTHKIRDMPPGFDKGPGVPTAPSSEDGREPSPDRRSSPDKMELKRSPPAHPPPMTHASPIDMPSLPKRPSGKRSFRYQRDMVLSRDSYREHYATGAERLTEILRSHTVTQPQAGASP